MTISLSYISLDLFILRSLVPSTKGLEVSHAVRHSDPSGENSKRGRPPIGLSIVTANGTPLAKERSSASTGSRCVALIVLSRLLVAITSRFMIVI
jgi:hypothetical protein